MRTNEITKTKMNMKTENIKIKDSLINTILVYNNTKITLEKFIQ